MPISFRHYDSLRLFAEVARYESFSEAAAALNMTKGAISYQIKTLEADLGARLFERLPRGVAITAPGLELLGICRPGFREMERALAMLNTSAEQSLTVGMSSYFASRWLSPRLMTFMQAYPDIQLRIQPMTELVNLGQQGVDLAIRWGDGAWDDAKIIPLMQLSAWPVGNAEAADLVRDHGLAAAFRTFTLLRDHDGSHAWSDWLDVAGLPRQSRKDTLIIPDPNVRVQAVINGQGVALNDALVGQELNDGSLFRLSEIGLESYGYFLAVPRWASANPCVEMFADWVLDQQTTPVEF